MSKMKFVLDSHESTASLPLHVFPRSSGQHRQQWLFFGKAVVALGYQGRVGHKRKNDKVSSRRNALGYQGSEPPFGLPGALDFCGRGLRARQRGGCLSAGARDQMDSLVVQVVVVVVVVGRGEFTVPGPSSF